MAGTGQKPWTAIAIIAAATILVAGGVAIALILSNSSKGKVEIEAAAAENQDIQAAECSDWQSEVKRVNDERDFYALGPGGTANPAPNWDIQKTLDLAKALSDLGNARPVGCALPPDISANAVEILESEFNIP